MIRIEKSRWPTEIFTLHETVYDRTANALSGFLLVTVVTSTVKETVANFDCVINHLHASFSESSQWTVPFRLTSVQLSLGI